MSSNNNTGAYHHWHCQVYPNRIAVTPRNKHTASCPICGGQCKQDTPAPRNAIQSELNRLRALWSACKSVGPSLKKHWSPTTKLAENKAFERLENHGNYLKSLLKEGT